MVLPYLQTFPIGAIYSTYWQFIDFIIYLILFGLLIDHSLKKADFEKKGTLSVIIGLVFALSLTYWEYSKNQNMIEFLGPHLAFILFIGLITLMANLFIAWFRVEKWWGKTLCWILAASFAFGALGNMFTVLPTYAFIGVTKIIHNFLMAFEPIFYLAGLIGFIWLLSLGIKKISLENVANVNPPTQHPAPNTLAEADAQARETNEYVNKLEDNLRKTDFVFVKKLEDVSAGLTNEIKSDDDFFDALVGFKVFLESIKNLDFFEHKEKLRSWVVANFSSLKEKVETTNKQLALWGKIISNHNEYIQKMTSASDEFIFFKTTLDKKLEDLKTMQRLLIKHLGNNLGGPDFKKIIESFELKVKNLKEQYDFLLKARNQAIDKAKEELSKYEMVKQLNIIYLFKEIKHVLKKVGKETRDERYKDLTKRIVELINGAKKRYDETKKYFVSFKEHLKEIAKYILELKSSERMKYAKELLKEMEIQERKMIEISNKI